MTIAIVSCLCVHFVIFIYILFYVYVHGNTASHDVMFWWHCVTWQCHFEMYKTYCVTWSSHFVMCLCHCLIWSFTLSLVIMDNECSIISYLLYIVFYYRDVLQTYRKSVLRNPVMVFLYLRDFSFKVRLTKIEFLFYWSCKHFNLGCAPWYALQRNRKTGSWNPMVVLLF